MWDLCLTCRWWWTIYILHYALIVSLIVCKRSIIRIATIVYLFLTFLQFYVGNINGRLTRYSIIIVAITTSIFQIFYCICITVLKNSIVIITKSLLYHGSYNVFMNWLLSKKHLLKLLQGCAGSVCALHARRLKLINVVHIIVNTANTITCFHLRR